MQMLQCSHKCPWCSCRYDSVGKAVETLILGTLILSVYQMILVSFLSKRFVKLWRALMPSMWSLFL